jgi:hypothetical protein
VWHDDEDIEIDLTKTNRLKKLRKSDQDPTVVSGEVLTNVLQERWVTVRLACRFSCNYCVLGYLHDRFRTRQLEWAKVEDTRTAAIAEDRGFDDEGIAVLSLLCNTLASVFTTCFWM